jgi:7-cyano-7-deazaguanine synthase
MKKAVVLLSGGLDSATSAAMAARDGFELYALSFRYGQRHSVELEAAVRVAKAFNVKEHRIVDIDLTCFASSLLDKSMDVPKNRGGAEVSVSIPSTYVPARNTIFLSFALGWAETLGCSDIFIGVNALDYSGYPDCRPEYIAAFEKMANLATKSGVEGVRTIIHAPLIAMSKKEIIKAGIALGVDYSITHSCYDPSLKGLACGECDSCLLRKKGFEEAGVEDPTVYGKAGSSKFKIQSARCKF